MGLVAAGFLAFFLLMVNNLLVSFEKLPAVEHHRAQLTLINFRLWM